MKTLLLVIIFLGYFNAQAQEKHLIQFTDKDLSIHGEPSEFLSAKSLERRARQGIEINTRDYPVTPDYVEQVEATGAKVLYATRWLNGVLVEATSTQIEAIKALSFVVKERPLERRRSGTRLDSDSSNQPLKASELLENMPLQAVIDYGAGLGQASLLEVPALHNAGFLGEGISIAVIDAGFQNADQLSVFDSLHASGRLKGTWDFAEHNDWVFGKIEGEATADDGHGTKVLSTMAAYEEGILVGTAPKADYWLLKTEIVSSESPLEEAYWLVAAEYADSVGADIINSSLGYVNFDKSQYNHTYEDFDGDKILISQAADLAASTGILVITSAGNSGNDSWGYLSAPADGDSVMAVGGLLSTGDYWSTSSPGPTADGRIKPNVCAQGAGVAVANTSGNISKGSGTSYASPIMAGFAASLWQAYPALSNMGLLKLLEQGADQALTPDNQRGYGLPTYSRIKAIAGVTAFNTHPMLQNIQAFPNPSKNGIVHLTFPTKGQAENYTIEVVNAQGKILHESTVRPKNGEKHDLKLPDTVKGMYFINIKVAGELKALKLLRQ